MLIKNGLIHDAVHGEPYIADILVKDGKIAAIGENLTAESEEIIDARGLNIYPGLVEAHCHIGLDNYGLGPVGQDYNEYGDAVTPQMRGIDSFSPQDQAIPKALAAGVTTVCAGPGSSNVLGGTFVAVKTRGRCVDDMVLLESAAMKCAFGENPKRCYSGKGISARMTTAAKLREMLFKAKEYMEKLDAAGEDVSKRPGFDMKLHALLPVMRGEIPLKAHAHRADDICTAIRIAKEFGVRMTLEHCTEGHLIVDEVKRSGFPVAVGPIMSGASKSELANRTYATPGILAKAGIPVSIITDSPVTGEDQLALCAGMAIRAGMDPFDALRAVTINAARHIGVEGRVGSLEVGKDADIILCDGNLFEITAKVRRVILDGKTAAIDGAVC
ncbi:MAG: amidohydrolase [Clostridia bacterium]|nr:amidohydrolase [Clostridia bacterium]